MTPAEEFIEFATITSPRLRRTAFLLCGDWHTAEDLAQATLVKMFASWRRISRKDAADSYATRTLVNTYLADKRRKRVGEVLTDTLPERPVHVPTPEVRLLVRRHLQVHAGEAWHTSPPFPPEAITARRPVSRPDHP